MVPPDPENELPVVALVILKAASGEPFDANTPIILENLERFKPDAAGVKTVVNAFENAGFRAGPLGGVSLSISAPRETFESLFGVNLMLAPDETWMVDPGMPAKGNASIRGKANQGATHVLPFDQLPWDIRQHVQTIVFESPVELHNDNAFSVDQ